MRRLWPVVFVTMAVVVILISAVPGVQSKRFGGGGSSRGGGSSSRGGGGSSRGSGGSSWWRGGGGSNKNNQGSGSSHDSGVGGNSGSHPKPSAPVDHSSGSHPSPVGPGGTHYGWNPPNSNPASGSVGQNAPSYGWNVPNRNPQPGSVGGNHGSNSESRYPSQQYPNQHNPSQQYPNHQNPVQSFPGGPGATQYGWNPPNSNPASGSVGQNAPSYGWNVPNRNPQQYPNQHHPGQQYPGQQYPGQQYPGQQYQGQQYPGQSFPGGFSGYDGQRFNGGNGISNWNSGNGYKQPKGDWGWLGSSGAAYALSKQHKGPKWGGGGFGGGFGMPLIVPVPVPIVHHYRERPGWRGKVAQSIEPEGDLQGHALYTWVNSTRRAPSCFVTSRGVPCKIMSYSCNVSAVASTCNSTEGDCVAAVPCSARELKCEAPSKERLCRTKSCYSPLQMPVRCNITSFACNMSSDPATCNTTGSSCKVSAVPCNVTSYVCSVSASAWQAISKSTSGLNSTNSTTNSENTVDNTTYSEPGRITDLHFKPHHSIGERLQCNISTVTCNISKSSIQCNSTNGLCKVSSNKLECNTQIVLCNLTAMPIPCNVTNYLKVADSRVVTVESNVTDVSLSKVETITSSTAPTTTLTQLGNGTETATASVLVTNSTVAVHTQDM